MAQPQREDAYDIGRLNSLFAVSSVAFALCVVWMWAADYLRPWKTIQRAAADVEEKTARRAADFQAEVVRDLYDGDMIERLKEGHSRTILSQRDNEAEIKELRKKISDTTTRIMQADLVYQPADQAVQQARSELEHALDLARKQVLAEAKKKNEATAEDDLSIGKLRERFPNVERRWQHVQSLEKKAGDLKVKLDEVRLAKDEAERKLKDLDAEARRLEGLRKSFERERDQARIKAEKAKYGIAQKLSDAPLLDAFSPTLKPAQLIVDFPDARNFDIYVKRFDLCITCHVNIARREYSLEYYDDKVAWARREIARLEKAEAGKDRVEDPFDLRLSVEQAAELKRAEIPGVADAKPIPGTDRVPVLVDRIRAIEALKKAETYYGDERLKKTAELLDNPALKAHPNLDLFLSDGTPHQLNQIGCTICHMGDGRRTDFRLAAHTPEPGAMVIRSSGQKIIARGGEQLLRDRKTGDIRPVAPEDGDLVLQADHWKKKYGWKPNDLYYWEQPMLPASYVESSCLQCHFHVTDMPKEAAPKLNLAHRLIRDNACYGCHAIRGFERDAADAVVRQVRPDFDEEAAWKRGPSLENVHLKWGFSEAVRWIANPKAVRPTTRMPTFFQEVREDGHALLLNHRTDPDMPAIDDATILAIGHFLFDGQFARLDARGQPLMHSGSASYDAKPASLPGWIDPPPVPAAPDPKTGFGFSRAGEPGESFHQAGKRLFVESGCLACHGYDGLPRSPSPLVEFHQAAGDLERAAHPSGPFGPDLTGLHFKLHGKNPNSLKWLFNWARAPEHYWSQARMPNLRITDREALAIAAFLLEPEKSHHGPAGAPTRLNVKIPGANPFAAIKFSDEALNGFDPLRSVEADAPAALTATLRSLFVVLNKSRLSPAQAEVEWSGLTWRDKWNAVGRGMVRHYGCAGCHNIRGMENEKGIGTELSLEGSKAVKKLDFGGLEHEMMLANQYTREDWIYRKLLEPRLYDQGKYKTPLDKLKMPKFGFTADEAKALTTYILGLRVQPIPDVWLAKYNRPEKAPKLARVEGERLLEKYNCVGCHMLEPTRVTFEPRPFLRGRREVNVDWLSLPRHTAAHGLIPAAIDPLPSASAAVEALRADDDLKDLVDSMFFQFWRAPWQSADLQIKFRGDISPADRNRAAKVHLLALEPGLLKSIEALQQKNSFLRLDASSALSGIPRKDISEIRPAWGGRLYEAIYAYYATVEARDKAAELAKAAGAAVEDMLPYALQSPKLRRWDFADAYLKDYLSYLLYKAPPPLIGEGSKVQPQWLYQFLQNPVRIRPLALLNMPRYQFRPGEARSLVNYFASRDQEAYPYQSYPERQEGHVAARVDDLFARGLLRDDTYFWGIPAGNAVNGGRTFGEFAGAVADPALRTAARSRAWLHVGERTLFSPNAGNRCMNCHAFGDAGIVGTEASQPGGQKVQAGPNLMGVAGRLRPEYLWRWLPQPGLVLPGTAMPPNWGDAPHATVSPEKLRMFVPGAGQTLSPKDRNRLQIAAVIDLLMNPRETAMARPGARHDAVWPEIVKSLGFPADDPIQAGAAPGR